MELTKKEKKALYVLKEIDDNGHVIKELGKGFLVHVNNDDEQFLVSSASVLKHADLNYDTSIIQAERYHIPKKLFKKKKPRRFTFNANEIKVCDQSSFCYVKRNFEKDGVKPRECHLKFGYLKKLNETCVFAFVFDGQEVVKLKFKLTKEGTFELINKPKEYKVPEKANGAPVVLLYSAMDDKVIGLLDHNPYDGKWSPAFFKPDTLKSATITVQDPGKIHILPHTITEKEGDSVTFQCSLEGKPLSDVTWWHGDEEIDTSDINKYSVSGPSSVNNSTASLMINNLVRGDEGSYCCQAQNDLVTIKSDPALLTINYPSAILVSPSDTTSTESNTVSLTCKVEGEPQPKVTWFKNGHPLSEGDSRVTALHDGQFEATLTIGNVNRSDEGLYTCEVFNGLGDKVTSSSATLNVNYPVKIFTSPLNITKRENQSVTFKCSLEGKPLPKVTWWRGDVEIDTSDSNKYSVSGPSSVNNNTASLMINNLVRGDEGSYYCQAQNDLVTTIESDHAYLTVNYPPKILRSPSAVTQKETETVNFSCQYEGKPMSTVEWFVNDTKLDIHADQSVTVKESGNEINAKSLLTISNLKKTDEGMYKCVISNGVGTSISSAQAQLTTVTYAELYSRNLKAAILRRTEMQVKGIDKKELKTDDIFTNLTVRQGKKMNVKASGDQAEKDTGNTFKEMEKCSELFVDEKGEQNPRLILVSGDPGIGKTLFSRKLVRDWAKNCIFDEKQSTSIPKIRFAYLLTFRQLNSIAEKEISLSELLSCSYILDHSALVDEPLLEYIFQNPEELFLLLDGFDEYSFKPQLITEDSESNPPNPKNKIPVKDLINKIVWRKILDGSIIMITSRPGEASQLDKNITFDRYVQITGFSEQQVIEYVKKYFKSETEEVKEMALQKVRSSAHYISFARVPFMCYLMCIYIAIELKKTHTSDNSADLTLTQFYLEVVSSIEENYNRIIKSLDEEGVKSAVTQTLDNFSLLAAQLFHSTGSFQFSFTDQDLKELKLEEKQLSYLKCSNLLSCHLAASNSVLPKIIHEYSFNHFSLQEFFTARRFVSENKIPKQKMTEMVLQFMSGLMDPDKHEELMLELLECIHQQVEDKYRRRLVSMRCLYEFKYGGEVLTKVVSKNPHEIYWDSSSISGFSSVGCIALDVITDSDSKALAMFVNKLSSISPTLTNPPHVLYISNSSLSCCSVESVITSLTNKQSTITGLWLRGCKLDDKCIECLCSQLSGTQITWLNLGRNAITDQGVEYMVHHPCFSQLTHLWLMYNLVSDKCKQRTEQFCKVNYPRLELFI